MTNTYEQNKEIFKDFISQVDSLNYTFQKVYQKKLLNKFSFEWNFIDDLDGNTLFLIYFDCGHYVMQESFSIEQYPQLLMYCNGIRDLGFCINN